MKDTSKKYPTFRTATAMARLRISPGTIERIKTKNLPKSDPLVVARVAGIQGAKSTSQVIPYCHPIPVDFVGVDFEIQNDAIEIKVHVKATAKTGVEMEALVGVSAASLTFYDMLKGVDEAIEITSLRLEEKTGGKSDFAETPESKPTAAVLVASDRVSSGMKDDSSGPAIRDRLEAEGFEVVDYTIIPDEKELIKEVLRKYASDLHIDLVITTGGTGLGPRDVTPEATGEILEKKIPGIPEVLRHYGQARTPFAMLSRGAAGIIGDTIIINLPGSKRGVEESLEPLFPAILHAIKVIGAKTHET